MFSKHYIPCFYIINNITLIILTFYRFLSEISIGQYLQTQKQYPGKSTLVLDKVTDLDEGHYVCQVSNNVGKDINKGINIKVIGKIYGMITNLHNISIIINIKIQRS